MTGLLRASTLVRQPVVTLDGESLLEVKDVVFDRASGEILGFALRKKGSLGGLVPDRLPWPAVHGLGPDAVMISDESVLTSEGGGDLEGGGDVIGDRVLTESGTDLGEVVEVVIATGGQADVVGFEIEPVAAAAGDVRAVTFLLEQLPAELADISQELDGQSPDLIADQTVRAAADIVARDTVSVLEQYNEAAGQGRAATDAAETLAALSEGVSKLFSSTTTRTTTAPPASSGRAWLARFRTLQRRTPCPPMPPPVDSSTSPSARRSSATPRSGSSPRTPVPPTGSAPPSAGDPAPHRGARR